MPQRLLRRQPLIRIKSHQLSNQPSQTLRLPKPLVMLPRAKWFEGLASLGELLQCLHERLDPGTIGLEIVDERAEVICFYKVGYLTLHDNGQWLYIFR